LKNLVFVGIDGREFGRIKFAELRIGFEEGRPAPWEIKLSVVC
jgi:hypothetical protein